MNNPLTRPPLTWIAYSITICPNQQKARLRGLQARHAAAVKQLAFVEAQLASEIARLLPTAN